MKFTDAYVAYLRNVLKETDSPSNPKRVGVAKGYSVQNAIKARVAGHVVFETHGARMTRVVITQRGRMWLRDQPIVAPRKAYA